MGYIVASILLSFNKLPWLNSLQFSSYLFFPGREKDIYIYIYRARFVYVLFLHKYPTPDVFSHSYCMCIVALSVASASLTGLYYSADALTDPM